MSPSKTRRPSAGSEPGPCPAHPEPVEGRERGAEASEQVGPSAVVGKSGPTPFEKGWRELPSHTGHSPARCARIRSIAKPIEFGRNGMVRAQDEEPKVAIVGDDDLDQGSVAYLRGILREGETLVAVSGFSYGEKVLAITDQRVLVAVRGENISRLDLDVGHDDILRFERDGRTLIIEPKQTGERRYKFSQDQTVEELVRMVPTDRTTQTQVEDEGKSSIADRVRFWEEQDRINQELIPRVIRQNELLTKHIAEHDSLPEVAGRAISEALASAREEHRQQYAAALDAAKKHLVEQAQTNLDQTLTTLRQDMRQQYDAALDSAVRGLAQQGQTHLDQAVAAVRQETQKTRKILVGLASVAVAASVAALIVVLVT